MCLSWHIVMDDYNSFSRDSNPHWNLLIGTEPMKEAFSPNYSFNKLSAWLKRMDIFSPGCIILMFLKFFYIQAKDSILRTHLSFCVRHASWQTEVGISCASKVS